MFSQHGEGGRGRISRSPILDTGQCGLRTNYGTAAPCGQESAAESGEIAQQWLDSDRVVQIGTLLADSGPSCSNSAQLRPSSANVWGTCPMNGQGRPNLVDAGRVWRPWAQIRPSSTRCWPPPGTSWPNLLSFGPSVAELGTKFGRFCTRVAEFGPSSTSIG